MVNPSVEDSDRIVQRNHAFQVDRKVGLLGKVIAVDSMNVVSAVWSSRGPGQALISISLRGEIPCVGIRIDHTSCCNTNMRINVIAVAEIRLKERSS